MENILKNFIENDLPKMNEQIIKREDAKREVNKCARQLADEVCRKINNLQFADEIKTEVGYPHQLTLELLIAELQKRV